MCKFKEVDFNDPAISKALDLAQEFNRYCKENDLPRMLVLDGVALDAFQIAKDFREKGYLEGKAYEKGRITELLGLAI